jgi:hypothetical protein
MRISTTYFNALYLVCQQGSSEVVGAAATWGQSSRSAPCSIQQTRCTYIGYMVL